MLFREVFCAAGAVSFIFLYGTPGLIRGERSFFCVVYCLGMKVYNCDILMLILKFYIFLVISNSYQL